MKFPIKNLSVMRLFGKDVDDIQIVPKKLYDSITLGPKIDGQRLRNTKALLGTHRDPDFRTPLFDKLDENLLDMAKERIKEGKSIVENLYQVTGQIAKTPDQVAMLAKSVLGEPMLPTPGDIARKAEMKQAEEQYNKEIVDEGVLERDEIALRRRDVVLNNKNKLDEIDDNLRKITGNQKRPAPVKQGNAGINKNSKLIGF